MFTAPATPVAHVEPGETIETNTLDAFGNALKKPGHKLSAVRGDNPLTGPMTAQGESDLSTCDRREIL